MFDLAWSEIALIAVVAVVVIGPKDLPDAVRGVARGIQKLRRMAGEFQGHLDEVVREAKLEDVRDQIRDIRNFDIKSTIEKAVDEDGAISRTFRDDPFRAPPPSTSDIAPAAGTEATLPEGAPPVYATTPAPEVSVVNAAADTPDATPPAEVKAESLPPAAPEVAPRIDPNPPVVSSPGATSPVATGLDPVPPAEAPQRPATHTA